MFHVVSQVLKKSKSGKKKKLQHYPESAGVGQAHVMFLITFFFFSVHERTSENNPQRTDDKKIPSP